MPVSTFGSASTVEWASSLPAALDLTVCDPSGFGNAIAHLIDRGLQGRGRDLLIVTASPRSRIVELAFPSLRGQAASHDELLRGLDAVALGQLTLNGQTQGQFEQQLSQPELAAAFQDLTMTADRTFFRSYFELERAVAHYGYRPPRARVFTPVPANVPRPSNPESARAAGNGSIAVWAVGAPEAYVGAFSAATFDLRSPVHVLTSPDQAAPALEQASVVVSLCEDPGTAYALALFGKPLCAPVCGAGEIVDGLFEFHLSNRVSIVDALLCALGGQPSQPRALQGRETLAPRAISTPTIGPLVTIVMPTYSRPNTLREGLQRLTEQTYKNIEVVVVNNAGTPVDDVVADFPNARLINRSENTGNATRPRNDGIEAARGEYIALLDDDDVFFPDHISRMVDLLERSGADAAYSDFLVRFVDRHSDGTETVWGWDFEKPFGITTYELLVANRLGYFTVFMRRSLIDRIGLFAEEVLGGEEVEYWLRIARTVDFVHVAQPSSAYTVVRDWRGQLSEKSHALYAGGYEKVYERYPASDLPLVQQRRAAYVASLRSTATPPPMQPRYTLAK